MTLCHFDDANLIGLLTKAHYRTFFGDCSQKTIANTHLGDYHWYHVFVLMPTSDNPSFLTQAPKVVVCLGLSKHNRPNNHLEISYFIKKTPLIDLTINHKSFKQADFLWQENCLECFVEYDGADGYFEANVALDGRYNIYHFDSYRTPNVMPPRQAKPDDVLMGHFAHENDVIDGFYSRHIRLTSGNAIPTRLNPAVILYPDGKQPIFYATKHANPPDFHDKRYWQHLE